MSYLSADDLQMMRDTIANVLPDTAVIAALGTAMDANGGISETWTPVTGGTVACRIDPVGQQTRGMMVAQAGRETLPQTYQATFPYDAPLESDNRVTINGNTFRVIQLDALNSWSADRRCILSYIEGVS